MDGPSGTLAFSFLPDYGSDLVLDTDDAAFFTNAGTNYVQLRNTVLHELGHGFGLLHVVSSSDDLLMEPLIDSSFDGPQLDEVRGIHFHFGDVFEKSHSGLGNETAALATDLGTILGDGTVSVGNFAQITGADATIQLYQLNLTVTATGHGLLGDVNLDGDVNGLDVDPFVAVLLNGPYQEEADINQDGHVDGVDVDPFVHTVLGLGGAAAVPEPSTVVLAALGLLGLLAIKPPKPSWL